MKNYILSGLLIIAYIQVVGQELGNLLGEVQKIENYKAGWIMHPDAITNKHAVVLFRNSFELENVPESFIIHISADNRYRLFVNGKYTANGPAKSDLEHWYYETIDLAPLLHTGKNVLAVEVVNFGPKKTWSQFSTQTNFFVQGHSSTEQVVNSNQSDWRCFMNKAFFPKTVEWISRNDIASGLYVANPTDSMIAAIYPWNWEETEYDDSKWPSAVWSNNAGGRNRQYAGGINYSGGKLLYPQPIRSLKETRENLTRVARTEWVEPPEGFLNGERDLIIPPNQRAIVLFDQNYLTTGYPEMVISGGKGSIVKLGYAENLYMEDRVTKGNRNVIQDKEFIGIKDVFLPDGKQNRKFRPLSHRTFRYLQLEVETELESVRIHDLYNMSTAYPLQNKAVFETDDKKVNDLMEPGWRTASICAQDILMSDAYYEQMQYVGDSKVHNLAIMYLSGNDDLVRNQLVQADWSRIPEGLTLACYPNAFQLVIPFYSLVWIEMIYDHMMWAGDKSFTRQFESGIYNVLKWYENRIQDNGLTGPIEWWNFVDWSPGFKNGIPPGIENGNSALFSLEYAIALQKASEICRFIGDNKLAENYLERSRLIIKAVNEQCYNNERGLYSETPAMTDYSQHTNLLAVLSGAANEEKSREIMKEILSDTTLHPVALFFRFYLFEALEKANMGAIVLDELQPWYDMMDMGLSTFTEVPVEWTFQRSDCHPWSTSPNIHFLRTICGIRPAEPGYKSIEIKPAFGNLTEINATLPHPSGDISLDLKRKGDNLKGKIELGESVKGKLIWSGKEIDLKPGVNKVH